MGCRSFSGYVVVILVALTMGSCGYRSPVATTVPIAKPGFGGHSLTFVEHGIGSYYADSFAGRTTASGVPMNQNALTAASKDLPLGTKVQVTNLATGKTVEVVVNDRGPYVPGRVIDLSRRAAAALDMKKQGIAPVVVTARPAEQATPELKTKVAEVAVNEKIPKLVPTARPVKHLKTAALQHARHRRRHKKSHTPKPSALAANVAGAAAAPSHESPPPATLP